MTEENREREQYQAGLRAGVAIALTAIEQIEAEAERNLPATFKTTLQFKAQLKKIKADIQSREKEIC